MANEKKKGEVINPEEQKNAAIRDRMAEALKNNQGFLHGDQVYTMATYGKIPANIRPSAESLLKVKSNNVLPTMDVNKDNSGPEAQQEASSTEAQRVGLREVAKTYVVLKDIPDSEAKEGEKILATEFESADALQKLIDDGYVREEGQE